MGVGVRFVSCVKGHSDIGLVTIHQEGSWADAISRCSLQAATGAALDESDDGVHALGVL